MWVIWSEEHRAWWGAARWGYVPQLTKAGRYTEAVAREIVERANIGGKFNEIAIPDPLLRTDKQGFEHEMG
jgi:hypothetical protein